MEKFINKIISYFKESSPSFSGVEYDPFATMSILSFFFKLYHNHRSLITDTIKFNSGIFKKRFLEMIDCYKDTYGDPNVDIEFWVDILDITSLEL